MSTALLEDLPQLTLARLEQRASHHGQTPSQEVLAILEEALAKAARISPAPALQEPYGQETGLQDWTGFQPWQASQRSA